MRNNRNTCHKKVIINKRVLPPKLSMDTVIITSVTVSLLVEIDTHVIKIAEIILDRGEKNVINELIRWYGVHLFKCIANTHT